MRGRARAADKEALRFIASFLFEDIELQLIFYALGEDLYAKRFTQGKNCPNDGLLPAAALHFVDEGPVELDAIERK